MEVLCTKHPEELPTPAARLYIYLDQPTELVLVNIKDDMVTEVSGRLFGGIRPEEADLGIKQNWILRFWSVNGVPQESRGIVNPLRGKTDFLTNELLR